MVKTRNGLHVVGRGARLIMQDDTWDTIVDGTSGTEALPAERGKVWLEWVGQPSPFDDPTVKYLVARNLLDPKVSSLLRAIARRRAARIDGRTKRKIIAGGGPMELSGLSQSWVFGPHVHRKPGESGSYIQLVPFKDAELIMSCPDANQFRILGLASHDLDPVRTVIQTVTSGHPKMTLSRPERFRTAADFHRAMGKM